MDAEPASPVPQVPTEALFFPFANPTIIVSFLQRLLPSHSQFYASTPFHWYLPLSALRAQRRRQSSRCQTECGVGQIRNTERTKELMIQQNMATTHQYWTKDDHAFPSIKNKIGITAMYDINRPVINKKHDET